MFDLTGKVAVVTGGSSGLGVQFAHALGRQGASVVVIARREHMLKKVAEDIAAESGVKTAYYVCDVTVSSMVAETAEKIVRDFGRIDIAVNCAGGGNCGGNTRWRSLRRRGLRRDVPDRSEKCGYVRDRRLAIGKD